MDLGPSPHTRLPGCGYHVTSCLMFLLPQSYPCQHASPANGLSARTVSPDKSFHSWVPLVRHLPQHHVGSSFEEADITHSCLTVVRPCQKQCHLGRWVLRGLSHLRSLGFHGSNQDSPECSLNDEAVPSLSPFLVLSPQYSPPLPPIPRVALGKGFQPLVVFPTIRHMLIPQGFP